MVHLSQFDALIEHLYLSSEELGCASERLADSGANIETLLLELANKNVSVDQEWKEGHAGIGSEMKHVWLCICPIMRIHFHFIFIFIWWLTNYELLQVYK